MTGCVGSEVLDGGAAKGMPPLFGEVLGEGGDAGELTGSKKHTEDQQIGRLNLSDCCS